MKGLCFFRALVGWKAECRSLVIKGNERVDVFDPCAGV